MCMRATNTSNVAAGCQKGSPWQHMPHACAPPTRSDIVSAAAATLRWPPYWEKVQKMIFF